MVTAMNTAERLVVVSGTALDDLLELVRLSLETNGLDSPFARELRGAAAAVRSTALPEP